MRMSARKRDACSFACRLRRGRCIFFSRGMLFSGMLFSGMPFSGISFICVVISLHIRLGLPAGEAGPGSVVGWQGSQCRSSGQCASGWQCW